MRRLLLVMILALGIRVPAVHADRSVVIYTDDASGPGVLFANMAYNLVGHFTADIAVRDVLNYRAGDLAAFDAALYMGYSPVVLPDAFLTDVIDGRARVLWIAGNIDQLINFEGPEAAGFDGGAFEADSRFPRFLYKGRVLARAGDRSRFVVVPGPEASVDVVLVPSESGAVGAPYYLCARKLCYVADNPFPAQGLDSRVWVFADYLHEFFHTGASERRRALVRFEDLAPGVSNENLLDYFSRAFERRGIPFSMGVIPAYLDPAGRVFVPGTRFDLPDDAAFTAAIGAMMDRGGTLVDHGYTHQHGDGVSRVDWEFTQGPGNEPVAEDSAVWARRRVEAALWLFGEAGFATAVWETPHYAASHGDYSVFAEYFDAFYERPMVFGLPPGSPPVFGEPMEAYSQLLPYATWRSSLGPAVIPENLGYIDASDAAADPDAILRRAEEMSIVRDAVASFYFHHDMVDPSDLAAVIDGLIEMGYVFVSPTSLFSPGD